MANGKGAGLTTTNQMSSEEWMLDSKWVSSKHMGQTEALGTSGVLLLSLDTYAVTSLHRDPPQYPVSHSLHGTFPLLAD